jgi:hypothetical protein
MKAAFSRAALVVIAAAAPVWPSSAQPAGSGQVPERQLSLPPAPGSGSCSSSSPDEVVVCGHGRPPANYRLPEPKGFDPRGEVESVSRERHRLMEGGEGGIHSCNFVVGSGSWTGCELRGLRRAEQQGRESSIFGDIQVDLSRRRR